MNKCHFMGRLVRDPEIRYTQSDQPVPVAHYTLAIDRRIKRQGEPSADFLDFVAYGKAAEFTEKYLKKGIKVVVTARCQRRSYEKDGRKNLCNRICRRGSRVCRKQAGSRGRTGKQ